MGLMSLSNDDGDGNENGKKSKTTTLHVHHAFLYISLPSVHDYDVKMPNFTFCGEREHKTTTLQSFRIQLQKKLAIFDKLNEME